MSFFARVLHNKKRAESVVLVDIGADSVASACVRYEAEKQPAILYANRVFIELRMGEPHEEAMFRALRTLTNGLMRVGAPAFARATKSGTVDTVVVSIDAPWQETVVRTHEIGDGKPFIFTKSIIAEKMREGHVEVPEKIIADESVISTILNGYETGNPFDKKATHASVTILSSLIDRRIANGIISVFRELFHISRVFPIAGNSLRYQALCTLFPHERDALVLDVTGGLLTSITLIRNCAFVTMVQTLAAKNEDEWLKAVTDGLTLIAKGYPLPQTVFFVAHEHESDPLRQRFEKADLHTLWLSGTPPRIVPVFASHLMSLFIQSSTEPADIVPMLMALYYHSCFTGERHSCNSQ